MIHPVLDGHALHRLGHGHPDLSPAVGSVRRRRGDGAGAPGQAGHQAVLVHRRHLPVGGGEGHLLNAGVRGLNLPGQLGGRPDGQRHLSSRKHDIRHPLNNLHRHRRIDLRAALAGRHDGAFPPPDALDLAAGIHGGNGRIRGGPDDPLFIGVAGLRGRVQIPHLVGRQQQAALLDGDPRHLLGHIHREGARFAGSVRRLRLDGDAALFQSGHHAVLIHPGDLLVPGLPLHGLDAGGGGIALRLQGHGLADVHRLSLRRAHGHLRHRLGHQHVIDLLNLRVQHAGDDQVAFPGLHRPGGGVPRLQDPLVRGGKGDLAVAGIRGGAGRLQLHGPAGRDHDHVMNRLRPQQAADGFIRRLENLHPVRIQRHIGHGPQHRHGDVGAPGTLRRLQHGLDRGLSLVQGSHGSVRRHGNRLPVAGGIGQRPLLRRGSLPDQVDPGGFPFKKLNGFLVKAENVRRQRCGGAH